MKKSELLAIYKRGMEEGENQMSTEKIEIKYETIPLVTLLTEHSEEYQRRIKELLRGPYSLAAVATRAELHRKHPRGEGQSVRNMKEFYLALYNQEE